jgi:hypothetical protein
VPLAELKFGVVRSALEYGRIRAHSDRSRDVANLNGNPTGSEARLGATPSLPGPDSESHSSSKDRWHGQEAQSRLSTATTGVDTHTLLEELPTQAKKEDRDPG